MAEGQAEGQRVSGPWKALDAHVTETEHEWACDPDLGPYCLTCAEKEV